MIAALWEWVRTPPSSGRAYAALLVKAVLLCLVWSFLFSAFSRLVLPSEMLGLTEETKRFYRQPPQVIAALFLVFVAAEELMRLVPLTVLFWYRPFRESRWVVFIAAVAVSVWFGWRHVSNGPSVVFSLGAQGVCGLVFTAVFLKCGGLSERFPDVLMGLLSSYAVHLFFNLALLTLSVLVA